MKKNVRFNPVYTYLIILFLACQYGCVSIHLQSDLPVSEDEAAKIATVVSRRSEAIVNRDETLFIDLLDPEDTEYVAEQTSWFSSCLSAGITDFKLAVSDIAKRDENTFVVRLQQRYTFGVPEKTRKITFNETIIRSDDGFKFSDLELQECKTDHFIVRSTLGIHPARLIRIGREAEVAYDRILSAYGDAPDDVTIIKVYDDADLMNERTAPGIVREYVGGWYAYPEAIKIYIPKSGFIDTSVAVAHELVHKVTLTTTENLCVWFAEGLAVYFGDFFVWGGRTYVEHQILSVKDHVKPVKWIEAQDFSTLRGEKRTNLAYALAGMIVKHIEETYGKGKSKAIVDKLVEYPENGSQNRNTDSRNKILLHRAIKEILGVDMETFNEEWLRWIARYSQHPGA